MRNERGFALVITLLVTALLTALLVEFVSEVYVDASHSHNFVASQQAEMLAESGVTGGIKLLQFDLGSHPDYSSLLDLWAKPQSYDAGVGTVTVTIEEESGKLNINTATSDNGIPNKYSEMATRLFKKLEIAPDLMDGVLDWVDTVDTPHPAGAETSYYSTLKPPYKAKNARLNTVEELALVKGFTPEVLQKLRPCVTVYARSMSLEPATPINVNTASKEVLASLDDKLSDDLVARILDYRKTKPIKNLTDLNGIAGIESISTNFATDIRYSGNVFRIHSEAKVRESVGIAEAVVRIDGNKPVFLYWREY